MTFEAGFEDVERAADTTLKNIAGLSTLIKQFKKAAVAGDIPQLRKLSERLVTVSESTQQQIGNTASAWPFTSQTEEAYLKESYAKELIDLANAEGIQVQQQEDGLVAFPCIIRILPTECAVKINREKTQALRPSALVKKVKAIQSKKPKFSAEQFLEVLHRVYKLLGGQNYGATVALRNIYEALTLLPGSTSAYDQTDFIRDLFLLDRSGIKRTKSGATVSLPASTGTKGGSGTYSFVAPDGESVTYYGIRFEEAAG